jgi:hypothetical protein
MLNGIVLNSIIVTIETLTCRKSIADKLISSSHGYPDLMDRASRFIDTLTCGILAKYFNIAEAFHPWASRLRSTGKAHLGINNIKISLCKNISVRGYPKLTEGDFRPLTQKS